MDYMSKAKARGFVHVDYGDGGPNGRWVAALDEEGIRLLVARAKTALAARDAARRDPFGDPRTRGAVITLTRDPAYRPGFEGRVTRAFLARTEGVPEPIDLVL